MKASPILVATIASLLPASTLALVGISWKVPNVPSAGLKQITFPFDISKSPHQTGYYFAQQFNFVGQNDVGYTGLQPRPDAAGQPVVHAVFSSFIKGTTTQDKNCSPGADGGPGVSCSVEFSGPYRNYNLEIANTGGTTWAGTCVDNTTGKRVHVGSWTLPAGTQGIKDNQLGFVEYYPWNSVPTHSCSKLPYTSVTFGNPFTPTGNGSVGDAFEYGDCVGKVAFKTSRSTAGVLVQVGF